MAALKPIKLEHQWQRKTFDNLDASTTWRPRRRSDECLRRSRPTWSSV